MIELAQTKPASPQSRTRKKKVQYGYYDTKPCTPHPVIHMGGKYLERYGFAIGDFIEVHLESNRITITKAELPKETQ